MNGKLASLYFTTVSLVCQLDMRGTHVSLAGAEGADVATHVEVADEPGGLHGVHPGGEGEHGPLLRRRKLHLGQVVDEEVQLGGHAAQAGLDQPGDRVGRTEEPKGSDMES